MAQTMTLGVVMETLVIRLDSSFHRREGSGSQRSPHEHAENVRHAENRRPAEAAHHAEDRSHAEDRHIISYSKSPSAKTTQPQPDGLPPQDTLLHPQILRSNSSIATNPPVQDEVNGSQQARGQSDGFGGRAENAMDFNSLGIELNVRNEAAGEAITGDEDPESSSWIHRDKLARIESLEMKEAGIGPSRQNFQNNSTHARDEYSDGSASDELEEVDRIFDKRQRLQPPTRSAAEILDEEMGMLDDPRTQEEVFNEGGSPQYYYNQPGVKTASRIPVSTSSPMPISQEHLERNTPLPRKRGASGNWSVGEEDRISYNKVRSRGNSFGSPFLLDDRETTSSTLTPPARPSSRDVPQISPSLARLPSRGNPVSESRRTSANRAASGPQKPRVMSASNRGSSAQRPVTRDGRPANRPEGDPPWLATMYKPDPMLPPDQQMLPTHAKRLQQGQWEREGKYGSAFGRDFTPIAVNQHQSLQPPSSIGRVSSESTNDQPNDEDGDWPFKAPTAESIKVRP
ncbi:hypothetical protein MMC06_004951, partial [Schaereria dolodes]|nr:hypothetical protein [Schaereria dolodes]